MNATSAVLRATALLALACAANAQSIYLDFGDPASPWGVPPPTYGAAGPPGTWHGVSAAFTPSLVDVNGLATGASLSVSSLPMLDACDVGGTTGADAALYDDRWFFDPPSLTLTLSGLQPGIYRVHVHLLVANCVPMFQPLSVSIAGAEPPVDTASGSPWPGAPTHGVTYTTQWTRIEAGQDLVIGTQSPQGFCCYTQHGGLQILRYEPPSAFCSGDGSGAPCPCGNVGAAGRGCDNSLATGGALLRAASGGLPSVGADGIELLVGGLPPTAPSLFFQGTARIAGGFGTPFGDGLRCAGGTLVRLGVVTASSGGASLPAPGGTPISVLGAVPPSGGTRTYQVWYRNAAPFCTPDPFNLSNGLAIVWGV
jgi:hypothetical protein